MAGERVVRVGTPEDCEQAGQPSGSGTAGTLEHAAYLGHVEVGVRCGDGQEGGLQVASGVVGIGTRVLSGSLRGSMAELDEVFGALPEQVGPFEVDEIELSLAISGTGDSAWSALKPTLHSR